MVILFTERPISIFRHLSMLHNCVISYLALRCASTRRLYHESASLFVCHYNKLADKYLYCKPVICLIVILRYVDDNQLTPNILN